jgi:hypothetical protein
MKDKGAEVEAVSPIHLFGKSDHYTPISGLSEPPPAPTISDRRIDANEMINLIFGPKAKIAYSIVILIAFIPHLAGYVMIFSLSMSAFVPVLWETCNDFDAESCRGIYTFWAVFYCILMTGLTFVGYARLFKFQVVFLCFKLIMFVMMIVTCIHLIATDSEIDDNGHRSSSGATVFDGRYLGAAMAVMWHSASP